MIINKIIGILVDIISLAFRQWFSHIGPIVSLDTESNRYKYQIQTKNCWKINYSRKATKLDI
jgi:hypothetical protein